MTIKTQNTETLGNAYDFHNASETLAIMPMVYLISDGAYAVHGDSAYDHDLILNNGFMSGASGIFLEGNFAQISNFAAASISSTGTAVHLSGTGGEVINDGSIHAGGVAAFLDGDSSSVINNGTLVGTNDAIILGGYSGTAQNSGSISGREGIYSYGTNVRISNSGTISGTYKSLDLVSTGATVTNSGTINGDADIFSASAAAKLTNSGAINGNVAFGNGQSLVINTGSITGDVNLGNGNLSAYSGKNGTVSGVITGGTKANVIIAGQDGETMAGLGGHDTMTGGAGADTFAFSSYNPNDTDIIHSFDVTKDTIQLDHAAFTTLTPDATPVFAIGTQASSTSDHLFYNSTTGVLSYDYDGSAAGHSSFAVATLDTGLALTAHNFTVV